MSESVLTVPADDSTPQQRYLERLKANGSCVRCPRPRSSESSSLCKKHLQYARDFMRRARVRHLMESIVPACCPRCQGFILSGYNDPHCANCGWRAPIWKVDMMLRSSL